jgi:hypothetical protein
VVINSLPTHWTRLPSSLPAHGGKSSRISNSPLFDLLSLQQAVRDGSLNFGDDSQCEVVTRRCQTKLEELGWTLSGQVTKLFLALKPEIRAQGGDFRNAQWCKDSHGGWHPCDSYEIRFDEEAGKRNSKALLFYFKFSLSSSGSLMVSLISCHV